MSDGEVGKKEPAHAQRGIMLGIIGGLWGMMIGFFSFAFVEVLRRYPEAAEVTGGVADPEVVRAVSLGAPILAIAGGAMARTNHLAAAALLLLSAGGMYYAFGFGVFTMFPIAMCGLGGLLALIARQPDAH